MHAQLPWTNSGAILSKIINLNIEREKEGEEREAEGETRQQCRHRLKLRHSSLSSDKLTLATTSDTSNNMRSETYSKC